MRRPPFTTWHRLGPAPVQPWDLCPEPWRWTEYDPFTSEVEVWDFLYALTVLLKPKVIVETGTYRGESAGMMARACRENGIGHIWTFDINPDAVKHALKFLEIEGLAEFVTVEEADGRTVAWDRPIDLLFIDGGDDRLAELEHFVPFLTPRAVVAMHNAHDPMDVYHWDDLDDPGEHGVRYPRQKWNRILIPCPCGLWVMTKRR